jgi:hypothetical protein
MGRVLYPTFLGNRQRGVQAATLQKPGFLYSVALSARTGLYSIFNTTLGTRLPYGQGPTLQEHGHVWRKQQLRVAVEPCPTLPMRLDARLT